MEKMMSKIGWVIKCVFKIAYYAFCILWLTCSFYWAVFIVPYVTGFLKELGQTLPSFTVALIDYSLAYGIVCSVINIVYTFWHLLINRRKTSVFENKYFLWWVFLTNSFLFFWVLRVIFTPVYCTLYKMGN